MIVSDIVFPPSSADFSLLGEQEMRSNRRVLNLVGRALNKYSDYAVTIEGHANPTTAPNTPARTQEQVGDLRLSQQRAQAVADYLAANQNIDKSRLNVVGIGNARTVAPYDDPDENWKNRRVEFILHK
jgi:outer membrane protein OmpA-like peptidoglycan-associated protein